MKFAIPETFPGEEEESTENITPNDLTTDHHGDVEYDVIPLSQVIDPRGNTAQQPPSPRSPNTQIPDPSHNQADGISSRRSTRGASASYNSEATSDTCSPFMDANRRISSFVPPTGFKSITSQSSSKSKSIIYQTGVRVRCLLNFAGKTFF